MGYVADGDIADLFKPDSTQLAGHRITERAGGYLHERAVHHTPVAQKPPGVPERDWLRARRGRRPGTLRDRWHTLPVVETADGFEVEEENDDPVVRHVEYPTRPHLIVPRDPEGWLRWWWKDGAIAFAKVVHHPGTQGSYMLAKALAELSVEWHRIAAEEVARWAEGYWA